MPTSQKRPRPNPIRAARERAGLTQFQLAAKAGLSLQTVSLADRAGLVTERTASALAAALGVPPSEFHP